MNKNILQMLENSKDKYPDKLVFCDTKRELTYSQFVNESMSIGSYICNLNITKKPIAILIDREVSCLSSMMGVVYSGNFYTIIDVKMPADRVKVIFDTLSPVVLIANINSAPAYAQKYRISAFSNTENHSVLSGSTAPNDVCKKI